MQRHSKTLSNPGPKPALNNAFTFLDLPSNDFTHTKTSPTSPNGPEKMGELEHGFPRCLGATNLQNIAQPWAKTCFKQCLYLSRPSI